MTNEVSLKPIPYTRFMDMHSGGSSKTDYRHIYIQAPYDAAISIFKDRFNRDPENITCLCCGEDYSFSESPTLDEASGYDRACKWKNGKYVEEADSERSWQTYQTVEQYIQREDVLVIYANGVEQ